LSRTFHAQISVGIFKLELDSFRSRMTKCIDQGLPANSVNFMSNRRLQRLLPAYDKDAKFNIGFFRFSEGWHLDGKHAAPIKEVLAEGPNGYGCL
jgi:hypothetical protein